MSKTTRNPNMARPANGGHPQAQAVAAAAKNQLISTLADENAANMPRTSRYLADDEIEWALSRLSCGDSMVNVTNHLKVSPDAFRVRASYDPDFDRVLSVAIATGQHLIIQNAFDGLRGGVHSTGDVKRDKYVFDAAFRIASKLNKSVYGDHIQIDQRVMTYQVPDAAMDQMKKL